MSEETELTIVIKVTDPDQISSIKAVGVKDIADHFLPKAYIHPVYVMLKQKKDKENMARFVSGKSYTHYEEIWTKGGAE